MSFLTRRSQRSVALNVRDVDRGAAAPFEKDPRVRYFINLGSSGGFGNEGPKNVVYRTPLYNTVHYKDIP